MAHSPPHGSARAALSAAVLSSAPPRRGPKLGTTKSTLAAGGSGQNHHWCPGTFPSRARCTFLAAPLVEESGSPSPTAHRHSRDSRLCWRQATRARCWRSGERQQPRAADKRKTPGRRLGGRGRGSRRLPGAGFSECSARADGANAADRLLVPRATPARLAALQHAPRSQARSRARPRRTWGSQGSLPSAAPSADQAAGARPRRSASRRRAIRRASAGLRTIPSRLAASCSWAWRATSNPRSASVRRTLTL